MWVRFLVAFFIWFSCCPIYSSGQGWAWARSATCGNYFGSIFHVNTADNISSNRGIYFAGGHASDSFCLPPYTLYYSRDTFQCIIAKHDTSGNIMWLLASTTGLAEPNNIIADHDGNLLVLGSTYTDTVTFGSHMIVNPNYIVGGGTQKNHCYFLMKVDPYGNVLWSKVGGNVEVFGAYATYGDIAVDASHNIYVFTSFDDTTVEIESHIFTNTYPDTGDIILVKYDSAGNYKWAKTFGGVGDDHGISLKVGKNNHLYVAGWFDSPTLTFDGITLISSGTKSCRSVNAFLAELDTGGNTIWATSPSGNADMMDIVLDTNDHIYVGGRLSDTSYSFGSFSLSTAHLYRGSYLAKFDTNGSVLWTKFFYPLRYTDCNYTMSINGMTIDPCNNLWFTGCLINDSISMNGTTLISTPPTNPYEAMLFGGITPSGFLFEHHVLKGGGDDKIGLASDCSGNIYFADATTLPFRIGADTIYRIGGENAFLAKYNTGLGCASSCSIGDVLRKSDISYAVDNLLFPNPADNRITVNATVSIRDLAIYDLIGKEVFCNKYNSSRVIVDVSALSPGLYFVKINGCQVIKFAKQ